MTSISGGEAQFRDATIIRLGADPEFRNGEEPVPIVRLLSGKDPPGIDDAPDRVIDAPMVLLEGDRKAYGIETFYFDPPAQGPSIPVGLYLPKWAGFSRLLLSEKNVGGMRQCDYAFALLQRAVEQCRSLHGGDRARALAQSLNDNRWSLGPEMTAHLLTSARLGPRTMPREVPREEEHKFLTASIRDVRAKLAEAKQSCCDLTEWCEALYSINPRVWELLMELKGSDLPDAESYYRFFAEVDADIPPCSLQNVFTVIEAETGEKGGPTWLWRFLNLREEAADLNEFRQKLLYLLHSRTTLPKFWVDLAVQSYDLPKKKLPAALGSIDPWRAVSTDVLRASAGRWLRGGR